MTRSVMCAVSPSAIATLMGFEPNEVLPLESIQLLLVLHEDINYSIQPSHKLFPDSITDLSVAVAHGSTYPLAITSNSSRLSSNLWMDH